MPEENNRDRLMSFEEVDETEASGILADVLRENNVFLGGSSVGKGLKHAARFYLRRLASIPESTPDDEDLFESSFNQLAPEDPFFVVDLGVVVSQVYSWRKYFPRVEPFYAIKANPDPVIVRTLAALGCNFDCASRSEIDLVLEQSKSLSWRPQIIYANPCKGRSHIADAVRRGVRLMTFDNVPEVAKVASVCKKIQMVLRIITDDRGSQCRLSSKFGAPRNKWRELLQACKDNGIECVGVSFHVGSGCRDATRYEAALTDAREVFDMAEKDFGFRMTLLDIGGGFPGETHSMWNPAEFIDGDQDSNEGLEPSQHEKEEKNDHFLFFNEIAEQVAPIIDRLFPDEQVRVIAEPGRYFVAAASTLMASVIGARNNALDDTFCPDPVDDREASHYLDKMTRRDEMNIVKKRTMSMGGEGLDESVILDTIVEEFEDYSKLFAKQNLAQQEADVYNDGLDLYTEDFETAADILGPPTEEQQKTKIHSAEGMIKELALNDNQEGGDALLALAAAGEAAVNGVVLQAIADSAPLQDDYAYYINDGVYSSFNNIMFDHATVRPRQLKHIFDKRGHVVRESLDESGFHLLEADDDLNGAASGDKNLYASTVFGPTCDSIDVIARSVLLPKLQIGDWLYFQNMGAYTSAAASSFNGFAPSERFYVCSVQPEYFEQLIAGPEENTLDEEKKDDI